MTVGDRDLNIEIALQPEENTVVITQDKIHSDSAEKVTVYQKASLPGRARKTKPINVSLGVFVGFFSTIDISVYIGFLLCEVWWWDCSHTTKWAFQLHKYFSMSLSHLVSSAGKNHLLF